MRRSLWQTICGPSHQDPASEALVLCGGSLITLAVEVALWSDYSTRDGFFWALMLLDGALIGVFLVGVGMFIELGLRKLRGRKETAAHG